MAWPVPANKTNSEFFRSGIVAIAALIVVFGIYGLFNASLPAVPKSLANGVEREAANELPPPEPMYNPAALLHMEPGKSLEFGLGKDNQPGSGNAVLISGWSAPEPGGIWTLGKYAVLGFIVRCKVAECRSNDALLHFDGTMLSVPGYARQIITFWVDGKKVDQVTLRVPQEPFTVELKDVAVQDGTPVILTLHLPDAVVLANVLPVNDMREIAFRIANLKLEL